MPPKKAVKEEKIHLGRPGNSLKSGIVSESPASYINSRRQVGLANVGKSTLFQAITKCSLGNPAVSRPSYALQPVSDPRRIFHMPPSTPKRRASSSPMSASTGW
jgi:hypothetical protein